MPLSRRSSMQGAGLACLVALAGAAAPAAGEDWGPVPGTLVDVVSGRSPQLDVRLERPQ